MKLAFFLLNIIIASKCFAEFLPEEIIILTNSNNTESSQIANLYAKAREIPTNQIISLTLPDKYNIDRQIFNEKMVLPLKSQIKENPALQKAKIIVTTYGVPLKIDDIQIPENTLEIQETLRKHAGLLQEKLKAEFNDLNQIKAKLNLDEKRTELNEKLDFSLLQQELQKIYGIAFQKDPKSKETEKIKEISVKLFGIVLLSQNNNSQVINTSKIIKSTFSKMELDLLNSRKVAIQDIKTVIEKDEILKGIIGALIEIKIIADKILAKESSASIDSELSLLWSLPDGSPISNRIPNPLFLENKIKAQQKFPMLLVSRLDGPTPEVVKRNIIDTILSEKNGYTDSNFLIDSRGLSFEQRDEMADWDRKLVDLARMDFGNKIKIDFDGNPNLAGKLENISLYVGWYQVRNYQDSYKFSKGAIGYHIASAEAFNLHDETEKGWCKNMLERGVVATVGAIDEPYLDSFPDPLYFFPLLATGEYNLIESYYLSTKYLSWRLILFGDPLYNPFKNSSEKNRKTDLNFPRPEDLSNRIISASTLF